MSSSYRIKSFKHNGHLHRMWLDNWMVPQTRLFPLHVEQSVFVFVNVKTRIIEGNGKEWVSKTPAVSYFIPNEWFNIIGLIEESGVRYYCNIASPPYFTEETLTYIDYDLDVTISHDRQISVVDQDEYELNKMKYHYTKEVESKVQSGLEKLLAMLDQDNNLFRDEYILGYYELWKKRGAV